MIADTGIQVWLDVDASNGQTIVAPYVSSATERNLQYEFRLRTDGKSGSASIKQSGTVHVDAKRPARVSSATVKLQPAATCKADVNLRENGQEIGRYELDCGVK